MVCRRSGQRGGIPRHPGNLADDPQHSGARRDALDAEAAPDQAEAGELAPLRYGCRSMRRSVRLSHGEAWFEVNHDTLPFTVQTGTGMVEVTGTSFNVWNDPNGLTVALATGEVVVSPGSLSSVHLTPGMQAAFDRKNGDVK